jgi:phosphate acetyltransferase
MNETAMVPRQDHSPSSSLRSSFEIRHIRHVFYLVSTAPGVGLTSVCLGLVQALDREGIDVGFFKPFRQPGEAGPERSTAFLRAVRNTDLPDPLSFESAEALVKSGGESRLLQEVVENFEDYVNGRNVIVVEGLQPTAEVPELEMLNRLIAKALDAEVIIVSTMKMGANGFQGFRDFQDRLVHVAESYGGIQDSGVIGCIVNKFNAPTSQ